VRGGREYVDFSSNDYLGLSGHPALVRAAKEALEAFGVGAGASRLMSGDLSIHHELEAAVATFKGAEAALVFNSGYQANTGIVPALFGRHDGVFADQRCHASQLDGALLSRARLFRFRHNDPEDLSRLLAKHRAAFRRALVMTESVFSMDGDRAPLSALLEASRRHRCLLMVDEAHSFGTMGRSGLGIREHFGLEGGDVDVWMGTLSKSLAGCGGFIAGERALIDNLKFAAPGFVYSVGMAPPLAAASLAALECMRAEPERVRTLQARAAQFLRLAREARIDVGSSSGVAIVPAIIGSSIGAARLSQALFRRGLNVQPILYPAVPENGARLRFFLSSLHTEEQVRNAVAVLAEEIEAL